MMNEGFCEEVTFISSKFSKSTFALTGEASTILPYIY